MKTVTFCGHAEIYNTDEIRIRVREKVIGCIEAGAEQFYLGGCGAFDKLAASVVHELKKEYPMIMSTLVIPYPDRRMDELDCRLYDDSVYPPIEKVPLKFAILSRNKWMIENSDAVIAYVTHEYGGAYKTKKYAMVKKKIIIDLK